MMTSSATEEFSLIQSARLQRISIRYLNHISAIVLNNDSTVVPVGFD